MGWIDLAQYRDKMMGSCEGSNENSGYIRDGEFLDYLKNYDFQEGTCFWI